MSSKLPLRYFFALTHLTVFAFSAMFVAFFTYKITAYYFEQKNAKNFSQIAEKASAENGKEFLLYEKREVLAARPNNLNRTRVSGYVRDMENGEDYLIYIFTDEALSPHFQKTVPTSSILPSGHIFINGVSNLGFAVLDSAGNNVSHEFNFLRNRDFPAGNALAAENGEFLFSYGPDARPKQKNLKRTIYWETEKRTEKITHPSFPGADFWLRPLGWSRLNPDDKKMFYAQKESHEPVNAELWRITLPDKKVYRLTALSGVLNTQLTVCPAQDFAVAIKAPLDPSAGNFGNIAQGPSDIFFIDLLTDTAARIYSSKTSLTNLLVSCGSERILVREDEAWRQLDITGKKYSTASLPQTVLEFADDGKTVAIKQNKNFFIQNLKTGNKVDIGQDAQYTVIGFTRQ